MTLDDLLFLGRDAMLTTLMAAAPMLISGMVIGLFVSVFQSVTQVQEIWRLFL